MKLSISKATAGMIQWPEFLQLYARYVASPAAAAHIPDVRPVEDPAAEMDLTREVLACAQKQEIPGLSGLEDIGDVIRKSAIANQTMEGIELFRIARLAALNNDVRQSVGGWKGSYPRLSERCGRLA